jgi:hypothetical protein
MNTASHVTRIEIQREGYLPDMIPNAGLHQLKDGIDYELLLA